MPKLKTHKGAKARIHITSGGKMMRVKIGKSHLRRKKTKRTKRLFDEKVAVHHADRRRLRKMLPGGLA